MFLYERSLDRAIQYGEFFKARAAPAMVEIMAFIFDDKGDEIVVHEAEAYLHGKLLSSDLL